MLFIASWGRRLNGSLCTVRACAVDNGLGITAFRVGLANDDARNPCTRALKSRSGSFSSIPCPCNDTAANTRHARSGPFPRHVTGQPYTAVTTCTVCVCIVVCLSHNSRSRDHTPACRYLVSRSFSFPRLVVARANHTSAALKSDRRRHATATNERTRHHARTPKQIAPATARSTNTTQTSSNNNSQPASQPANQPTNQPTTTAATATTNTNEMAENENDERRTTQRRQTNGKQTTNKR